MEEDPEELRNLAKNRPEIVLEMQAHLCKFCSPEEENRRAADFVQGQLAELAKEYGA